MTTQVTPPRQASPRAGWIAALVLAVVYAGVAIAIDLPEDAGGIHSDEATYYLMAHSLAWDGDLAYRGEDILRARRELPGGPSGLFLKQGRDVTGVSLAAAPPFFRIDGVPDPDRSRLFYGKSYIFPAVAAPFVRLFGTNGFLWLNTLLLAASFLLAYRFIGARAPTVVALLLAGAFVLATVVPVYVVWMMPELFNFAIGLAAYFLWLFKEVETRPIPRAARWLRTRASDLAAAVLIGLATFSKITNGVLVLPFVGWLLWRRQWRHALATSLVFGITTAGLFAINVAITGDWNYQGGPRRTYYGTYAFEAPGVGFEVGNDMARDESLAHVIFDPEMFWTNLGANLKYTVIGRYGGLLPYFFPSLLGLVMFLAARGQRRGWQWFILGGVLLHVIAFIVTQPYTYFGSAGAVGNRYFMGIYGACVFLFPPVRSLALSLLPWIVGATFTARVVLHPFAASLRPADAAKSGPLRILPAELTNVNDLPINTESHRVRVWYGDSGAGDIGFQIYHLDDNAYLREDDRSFWVRGESRAEMLIKTDRPVRHAQIRLSAGLVETTVTVSLAGREQTMALTPGQTTEIRIPLGEGFPYKKDRELPAYVWVLSISSSGGFTPPMPRDGSPGDDRYLGVRVRPLVWE